MKSREIFPYANKERVAKALEERSRSDAACYSLMQQFRSEILEMALTQERPS